MGPSDRVPPSKNACSSSKASVSSTPAGPLSATIPPPEEGRLKCVDGIVDAGLRARAFGFWEFEFACSDLRCESAATCVIMYGLGCGREREGARRRWWWCWGVGAVSRSARVFGRAMPSREYRNQRGDRTPLDRLSKFNNSVAERVPVPRLRFRAVVDERDFAQATFFSTDNQSPRRGVIGL